MSEFTLPKISQSLIKAFFDYVNQKECGIYFEERYIKKNPACEKKPTEAMLLGIYFEYLATGALPRSGEIPTPKKTTKGEITEPYKRAQESAQLFREIIKHYNIKILSVGKKWETKDGENGILDVEAEWDGERVIIDLKYSGLINDKWNEMGWDLESLPFKDSLMIQVVQYKYLGEKILKNPDIPFFFFVFDANDSRNAKIINVEVDEAKRQSHVVLLNNVKSKIIASMKSGGFVPYPQMARCNECPLQPTCKHAVKYPLIDQVYYG